MVRKIIIWTRYKNHPRPSQNSIIKNLEFFLLVLYFLNFLFICLSISLSLDTFSCYIPWFSYHSHHTRVNQAMGAFPCPILHLPEPFTTSCKAACLLFRYYLHINAARELAGKHLIFDPPHPLSNIWPPLS